MEKISVFLQYGGKSMKKNIKIMAALSICILLLFAGCGGSGSGSGSGSGGSGGAGDPGGAGGGAVTDTLTIATADLAQQLLDTAKNSINNKDAIPETFVDPITSENSPGMLGMTPDDFVSFVDEATSATGMLMTQAFQVAVVKCKDIQDAELVDGMIRNGFDSGKWICVFPEQSLTMVSGSYVLLAVGSLTATDALAEAFGEAAGGNVKGPNIFYSGETGGGVGGGGLGLDLGIDGEPGVDTDSSDNVG